MHPQPQPTSPWPYRPWSCLSGVRAWIVAVVAILAALVFLSSPAPPAGAQEAQEAPGVEVGDGTVRIGDDVFAGDGCARAGDVVAGDCGERPETKPGDEPAGDDPEEKSETEESTSDEEQPPGDNPGETTILKETTAPENPGGGTTVQVTTGTGGGGGGTIAFSGGTVRAETASGAIEACPAAPSDDAATATVARAVDGDTVELQEPVNGYDTVRLIGVDTPELEGEDGGPEPGAEEASRFTAEALGGREVLLETDEEVEDQYSRLLAYVWLVPETGEPELFNRTLVADGYAETMTVEPNDAYAECLAAAEDHAGEDNPAPEGVRQSENDAGLLGRLRDLLSSETSDEGASKDGATAAEDQYVTTGFAGGSAAGPGSTELENTEATEPTEGVTVVEESDQPPSETTGGTSEGGTGLTGANSEAENLAAVPPEDCPGATVVLEPFGTDGDAQSDPFEVTGGTFVVRADLKSEKPAEARLDVTILDTETQEPVEEFDQRTLGSYDTLISQGPGSYLLDLQPTAGSYEVAVFDCAEEGSEQGISETADPELEGDPGARLNLGSSTPPATPPAPRSGGSGLAADQPAEIELAAGNEPLAPADDVEPSDVALPTRDAPSGEVAVLPDTGGPIGGGPLLALVAGASATAVGAAGLAASAGLGRSPGRRSGVDGR